MNIAMGRVWLKVAIILLLAAAPVGAARAGASCTDEYIPVSIAPGGPKPHQIYGRLCHPASGPSSVIQILVHGFTYDHRYWSSPGYGETYDYVKRATEAGYSTLAIDRLGTADQSSRPPSLIMTLAAHANALHDIVAAAQGGGLSGGPYETVILVDIRRGPRSSGLRNRSFTMRTESSPPAWAILWEAVTTSSSTPCPLSSTAISGRWWVSISAM